LKALVIGAHPDDCELLAAGTAALWHQRGDKVRFLSMTDGGAGHHEMTSSELAQRRADESRRSAAVLGIESEIYGVNDGAVTPSIELRDGLIRRIRAFAPDLILTHRTSDYHPDHRHTGALVQDTAYLVTVPLICPDVPPLRHNPVYAYLFDPFTKPAPFRVDVAVNIDPVMPLKWSMLHEHASQLYEWLPYIEGFAEPVPANSAQKRDWLERTWEPYLKRAVAPARSQLSATYGADASAKVQFTEAFEISEFGRQPMPNELKTLFPIP
jgi:LmbE family N-acetylglucosaminyl deacetylase